MTLPNERTRSIQHTRDFLRALLDPKQTPKVPKEIRARAYWCLRHFPSDYDLNAAAKAVSKVFGVPEDDR